MLREAALEPARPTEQTGRPCRNRRRRIIAACSTMSEACACQRVMGQARPSLINLFGEMTGKMRRRLAKHVVGSVAERP